MNLESKIISPPTSKRSQTFSRFDLRKTVSTFNLFEKSSEAKIKFPTLKSVDKFLSKIHVKMGSNLKLIEESKSDPIKLTKKLLKMTPFTPEEISNFCSVFENLNSKENRNIEAEILVNSARISLECGRVADAVDFCHVILEKEYHEFGGWEICLEIYNFCDSISKKRNLLQFALEYCSTDRLPYIIEQMSSLEIDFIDDDFFTNIDLMDLNPLKMISSGVKRKGAFFLITKKVLWCASLRKI